MKKNAITENQVIKSSSDNISTISLPLPQQMPPLQSTPSVISSQSLAGSTCLNNHNYDSLYNREMELMRNILRNGSGLCDTFSYSTNQRPQADNFSLPSSDFCGYPNNNINNSYNLSIPKTNNSTTITTNTTTNTNEIESPLLSYRNIMDNDRNIIPPNYLSQSSIMHQLTSDYSDKDNNYRVSDSNIISENVKIDFNPKLTKITNCDHHRGGEILDINNQRHLISPISSILGERDLIYNNNNNKTDDEQHQQKQQKNLIPTKLIDNCRESEIYYEKSKNLLLLTNSCRTNVTITSTSPITTTTTTNTKSSNSGLRRCNFNSGSGGISRISNHSIDLLTSNSKIHLNDSINDDDGGDVIDNDDNNNDENDDVVRRGNGDSDVENHFAIL